MRVVLSGTYSSWNKGDAAMELATARALEAAGDVVVIASPFADDDRDTYAPTTVVQCNRRGLLGFVQLVLAALAGVLGRPQWLLVTDELRAMGTADVVVDLSGDMLTEDYGVLVAVSHYLPLLTARLLGVPYVVCAQSIGPFDRTAPLAHWLLRGAAAVTAREAITEERLRPVVPGIERTADMAYLLTPEPDRVPEGLVPDVDGPVIGVSLSNLVADRHEPGGAASFDDEVVTALEQVLADHPDHHLRFVAHVTGPTADKDDRTVARRVAARLGERAHVVDADLHPAAVKAVVAGCHVMVGARMHANIAALTSGVPVLAIGYSHKTAGIMGEFGQDDMVVDSRTLRAEDLRVRLTRLLAERDERSATLRETAPRLRAAAERNLELIRHHGTTA